MDDSTIASLAGAGAIALLTGGIGALTPIAIMAASVINSDTAKSNANRNIKTQEEREDRLKELQERHRLEDKQFQQDRDQENRRFQLEVEAQRMDFQEHLEMRRLQLQVRLEEQRERFQAALQSQQFEHSRELVQFQAQAMRETQILVSRENAQNMLGNQVVLEALKTFPLNISPMVLLNNRPHALSSLLRFTTKESIEIKDKDKKSKLIEASPIDVVQDVLSYAEHPEALNIFIAPVFVDSKVEYQKELSTKIWEATYQRIESFFTKNYSRSSKRPVVFYPTAWNDKYTSGVHASETLHFFLKDLPCIVLEPKFDGNTFRMAVSSWGLGYGSTEHFRTECAFDVNIDLAIAMAVYERSKNGLEALEALSSSSKQADDNRKIKNAKAGFDQNIAYFEALKLGGFSTMDKAGKQKLLNQLSALGLKNIFLIDSSQDLVPIANYFASQIGAILAMLSDVHHLIATRVKPNLPRLMKSEGYFSDIYNKKDVCKELYNCYDRTYALIREEECGLSTDSKEREIIRNNRIGEIESLREQLGVSDMPSSESWEVMVRRFVQIRFGYENDDFENVWNKFIYDTDKSDISTLMTILTMVKDEEKYDQLNEHIGNLQ